MKGIFQFVVLLALCQPGFAKDVIQAKAGGRQGIVVRGFSRILSAGRIKTNGTRTRMGKGLSAAALAAMDSPIFAQIGEDVSADSLPQEASLIPGEQERASPYNAAMIADQALVGAGISTDQDAYASRVRFDKTADNLRPAGEKAPVPAFTPGLPAMTRPESRLLSRGAAQERGAAASSFGNMVARRLGQLTGYSAPLVIVAGAAAAPNSPYIDPRSIPDALGLMFFVTLAITLVAGLIAWVQGKAAYEKDLKSAHANAQIAAVIAGIANMIAAIALALISPLSLLVGFIPAVFAAFGLVASISVALSGNKISLASALAVFSTIGFMFALAPFAFLISTGVAAFVLGTIAATVPLVIGLIYSNKV